MAKRYQSQQQVDKELDNAIMAIIRLDYRDVWTTKYLNGLNRIIKEATEGGYKVNPAYIQLSKYFAKQEKIRFDMNTNKDNMYNLLKFDLGFSNLTK